MNSNLNSSLSNTAAYIASLQTEQGAVPWFKDGIIDPWDHVEALMGLSVAGYQDQVHHGFEWLADAQREDGAWWAGYTAEGPADATRAETNFVAYPATGLWHHYLASGDHNALDVFWPMVRKALQWVMELQTGTGEVFWAVDAVKGISRDALVTGCSSIFKSLECGARIASAVGDDPAPFLTSRTRLGDALINRPDRFDRTWESKARYSMDWFYPVMTGVVRGDAARARLTERWHEFVEEGYGCRCVVERPWVTVAETCELTMACVAADARPRAQTLFESLQRFQVEDGSWWTGYVFDEDVHWPDERPTWTAGAILLAADALYELSSAHTLFTQHT